MFHFLFFYFVYILYYLIAAIDLKIFPTVLNSISVYVKSIDIYMCVCLQ